MKFSENKNGNLVLNFKSNINIDNGVVNTPQGEFNSEMELFTKNGIPTGIEWCVYDKNGNLSFVEEIGLVFEGRDLIDYDGVFELPIQAIKLIRKSGYKVSSDFIELPF